VHLDADGYVIAEGSSTKTNLPGVFASGDLVDHTYRQAVTAAGTGARLPWMRAISDGAAPRRPLDDGGG
jgi:thioredoxin reductase (NADPH)